MKLIGRRSVASVLRWVLGFINVFVTVGVVVTGAGLLVSMLVPDFASGFLDGLARDTKGEAPPGIRASQQLVYLAAFVASLSTWWVLNRLRRMFLAVNQGDAFDPANVGRLQGVGTGLIGIQVSFLILAVNVPAGIPGNLEYDFDLGGWLGILIVFMLAEVFRQGAAMRDDQQMTV